MPIPKYVINMDEFDFNVDVEVNTDDLHALLEYYMDKILKLLDNRPENIRKMQKVYGLKQYIPALAFDFEMTHEFEENVLLTGITYSQTGWKALDSWSLYVDDTILFEDIFTKELGEYKHMNAFYPVEVGQRVRFAHHNSSGNSKQIWWDIHYLVDAPEPEVIPEPEDPVSEEPEPEIDTEIGRLYDFRIDVFWGNSTDLSIVDGFWLAKTREGAGENVVFWNMDTTSYGVPGYRWSYGTDEYNGAFIDIDNGSTTEDGFSFREISTVVGHPHSTDKLYYALNDYYNPNHSAQPIRVRLRSASGDILDEINPAIIPFANEKRAEFRQELSESTSFPVKLIYEFTYNMGIGKYDWKRVY